MSETKVRCADCGILARRLEGDIVTLDEHQRRDGADFMPICGNGLINFEGALRSSWLIENKTHPERVGDLVPDRFLKEHSALVFRGERECASFVKWRPLLRTPKEHIDMLSQEWMRAAEERRDAWEKEWARSERRWRMFEILMLIVGGVVAAIVGAVLQKGI